MSTVLPPFTCTYTPAIPELMNQLGCSIILTTYQAGKAIFLSAPTPDKLMQLPRNFDKAMGIAINNDLLAVASKAEITVFRNSPGHAPEYPDQPNTYETLFIPKATYYTGSIDAHDLVFSNDGLLAVNTTFSCLSVIDHEYSFKPVWKPHFISEIAPGDRCHLNGVALQNGSPAYVTALGKSDEPGGWRANKHQGGLVMHVPTNKILVEGLSMPHTPRIYDDKLYLLNSGKGELLAMDLKTNAIEVIKSFPYFLRGMAKFGDYLFIGLSKIRKSSGSFQQLPVSETANMAGVVIIYLPFKSVVGTIKYETSVDEIYDVQVLPYKRPGVMSLQKDSFKRAIITKDSSYWVMPKE
jgi:uncharacterized protein (TIGR03032 family)